MGQYKDWVHKLPEERAVMEKLTDITDDLIETIKVTHPQKYNLFINEIVDLANLHHFNLEKLNESREHVPEHYTLEDTTKHAREKLEIDFSREPFNEHDFNFIVNEMHKLFHNIYGDEIAKYLELAVSWLDHHSGHAWKYYCEMYS